jgi:hypothetical protein
MNVIASPIVKSKRIRKQERNYSQSTGLKNCLELGVRVFSRFETFIDKSNFYLFTCLPVRIQNRM